MKGETRKKKKNWKQVFPKTDFLEIKNIMTQEKKKNQQSIKK